MKKTTLFLLFISISLSLLAQKEDRNWVFGNNCGINFNDLNNIQTFLPVSYNLEVSASISDSMGNLLLYIGENAQGGNADIRNRNYELIEGSEYIKISNSHAQGAIFLQKDPAHYYIVYSKNASRQCGYTCNWLYYSVIDVSYNNYKGKVIEVDIPIINDYSISEGFSAIRHVDGEDWWIIAREHSVTNCTNRFFKVLLNKNGVKEISGQNIGSTFCIHSYYAGEVTASPSGNLVSLVKYPEGIAEVFNFNRCTGELSNYRLLQNHTSFIPYSSAFSISERFLYLSFGAFDANSQARIYQYDLENNGNRVLIWNDDSIQLSDYGVGQIEMAPDGKIYVPYTGLSSVIPINTPNQYNQYLCVINQPDSLGAACDFQPFSFYLGDSSYASVSLPNMPNYNLGPLSIYKADAGKNKIICTKQQEKGTFLGDSTVLGVEYQWYPTAGMDSPNIAMPYVVPDSSMWYFVTITDTSIQNACQTRTDSVWVELQNELNATFSYTVDDSLVTFESLSEELLINHTWHFGNGTIGQGSTTENIYQYSEDSITIMHIVSSRCDADTAYATFLIKAPEIPVDTSEVVDTLSISSLAKNTLRVYPNPTNNLLHFESPFIEQVEIFNLTGKQITSSSEPQINVQNFSSGIYIYQVQMNNGTFVRGKFVKQ